jgi:hypothetical protein
MAVPQTAIRWILRTAAGMVWGWDGFTVIFLSVLKPGDACCGPLAAGKGTVRSPAWVNTCAAVDP